MNVLLAEKNTRVKWKSNYQEYISNLLNTIMKLNQKFLDKGRITDSLDARYTYKKVL